MQCDRGWHSFVEERQVVAAGSTARFGREAHASIAERLCAVTNSFSHSPSLTLNAAHVIATGLLTRHPAVHRRADLLCHGE